jgi:hypothetical protein
MWYYIDGDPLNLVASMRRTGTLAEIQRAIMATQTPEGYAARLNGAASPALRKETHQ